MEQIGKKIILGTAQFGLDYGINNQTGKPKIQEVFSVLQTAYENGIEYIDTAEAYGNAEEIIGKFIRQTPQSPFKIITKFHYSKNISIKQKIEVAITKLNKDKIDTVLFHSFNDFIDYPSILDSLIEIRNDGLIGDIGVSIYTNEEIGKLIEFPEVKVIQIPFNILDNHFQKGEILQAAKKSGKTIYSRSTFLQGLFFMKPNKIPNGLKALIPSIIAAKTVGQEYSLSLHELSLCYVLSKHYIDGVLIGVESLNQLKENIKLAETIISVELERRIDSLKVFNPDLLNPAKWDI